MYTYECTYKDDVHEHMHAYMCTMSHMYTNMECIYVPLREHAHRHIHGDYGDLGVQVRGKRDFLLNFKNLDLISLSL